MQIAKPSVIGNEVSIWAEVTYALEGAPNLVLSAKEVATFRGSLIAKLEDLPDEGMATKMQQWMTEHGKRLN